MKKSNYYQIEVSDGNGLHGKNGNFRFTSKKEAIVEAKSYKKNPENGAGDMSEENKKFWRSKNYTVQRITITEENIITI